jgi:hypothetical protein
VGQVGAASGVYLGNGWVVTAAHVGAGDFILNGTTYSAIPDSVTTSIATTDGTTGTADLTLFRIASEPDLPSLEIATSTSASSVVMLGFGGGGGKETWGKNTIDSVFGLEALSLSPWVSVDFATDDSATAAQLYSGDSGGGDFTYNPVTGQWDLVGINEAVGNYSYLNDSTGKNETVSASFMVALSEYASQINAITAVPEPRTWLGFGLGALLLLAQPSRLKSRRIDR